MRLLKIAIFFAFAVQPVENEDPDGGGQVRGAARPVDFGHQRRRRHASSRRDIT